MSECELCNQGDPSITVKCWSCQGVFHLHQRQLGMVEEGVVIIGDCPDCGVPNCWVKRDNGVTSSGAILYRGESIVDLRGKR